MFIPKDIYSLYKKNYFLLMYIQGPHLKRYVVYGKEVSLAESVLSTTTLIYAMSSRGR